MFDGESYPWHCYSMALDVLVMSDARTNQQEQPAKRSRSSHESPTA